MILEQITEMYGWNDYMDMHTGIIYQLSQSIDNGDGTSKVPVIEDGELIGYAFMKGVRV
jgi:hypothetical protein